MYIECYRYIIIIRWGGLPEPPDENSYETENIPMAVEDDNPYFYSIKPDKVDLDIYCTKLNSCDLFCVGFSFFL